MILVRLFLSDSLFQPENLLYASNDPDAVIKISDFGLEKFRVSCTIAMSGTLECLAPETLLGKL